MADTRKHAQLPTRPSNAAPSILTYGRLAQRPKRPLCSPDSFIFNSLIFRLKSALVPCGIHIQPFIPVFAPHTDPHRISAMARLTILALAVFGLWCAFAGANPLKWPPPNWNPNKWPKYKPPPPVHGMDANSPESVVGSLGNQCVCHLPYEDPDYRHKFGEEFADLRPELGWMMGNEDRTCRCGQICPYACKPGFIPWQWDLDHSNEKHPFYVSGSALPASGTDKTDRLTDAWHALQPRATHDLEGRAQSAALSGCARRGRLPDRDSRHDGGMSDDQSGLGEAAGPVRDQAGLGPGRGDTKLAELSCDGSQGTYAGSVSAPPLTPLCRRG